MSARFDLGRILRSPMERNAYALVAHQLLSASLGLIYWLLAARLYPATVVGSSSAFISTLLLVSGISQLGLAAGMARFIPRAGRHARRLVSSAYVVAIAASVVGGVVFLALDAVVGLGDILLGGVIEPWWVVAAVVGWTLFYLQDGVLIGSHQAVWVLVENFVYNSLKIAVLVIGVSVLGEVGIIGSWFLPVPVAVALVTWLVFGRFLRPRDEAKDAPPEARVTLREFAFSVSGDHLGSIAAEATVRLLPVFVVATAGAAQNAYFYQAWMVTNVIALVASGMTNSFVAETAATPAAAGANSRKILKRIAQLVVPATILVGIGAPLVLAIFGAEYAREGSSLLRWLALATLPFIFNTWYLSYLRVARRIRRVVEIQVASSVLMIALTFLGLAALGIAGVGLAWLATQLVVVGVTARDAVRVLRLPDAGKPSLRRGDWRFLLPAGSPRKTAVFAEGALADSASLLSGELVDGGSPEAVGCDVCVAESPDGERLRECAAALAPGGVLYAEWPPGAHRTLCRLRAELERAGFEKPVFYWPSPSVSAARLWLRLSPRPASYRRAVAALFDGSMGAGTKSSLASWLVLARALTPFVTKVVVARRVGAGDDRAPDRSSELAAKLTSSEPGLSASDLSVVMRTGGKSELNRINWMVWSDSAGVMRWVAKAGRIPAVTVSMERERDLLKALAYRSGEASEVVTPRLVLWDEEGDYPVMAETALLGTELLKVAQAEGYEECAKRVTRALADFAGHPPARPRSEWWSDLVEPWIVRLGEQLEVLGGVELADDVRAVLRDIGEMPLVFCHNDCTPWNIKVAENGVLEIFDWEAGQEDGLPLLDLVYCLSTMAFSLHGTATTTQSIESYVRLLEPTDEQGRVFLGALETYASAVGIRAQDVPRLRVMTWLMHATNDLAELLEKLGDEKELVAARAVCLPLLRFEVAALLAQQASEAAASRPRLQPTPLHGPALRPALFISPHLDDAALSCGGLIRRLADEGVSVVIATVCTDDHDGAALSALARQAHRQWDLGETPFQGRRAEDTEACRLLGAQSVHLGMRDAVYRLGEGGRPYDRYITACDATDATAFLTRADEVLAPLLAENPGALVFCPASVGGHVDHALVRHAVERLCDAERLVYYAEYPYWSRDGCLASGGRDLLPGAESELVPLTDEELLARVAATACYRSQLRGLFPSSTERARSIVDAHIPVLRQWVLGKPDYDASARRMAARLKRDVARCGGEYYLWLPVEGRGSSAADFFAALRR